MTAAITIHYRKPELTNGCIESLLADGWAPILVWDNSDDKSASLRVLEAKYADQKQVQFVRNSSNLGFGKGTNSALAELSRRGYRGPILLVNNDARVHPGMHAALHAQLMGSKAPTLVAPRVLQDSEEHGWLYYQPWLALVTQRRLPGSFAYLSGCCLLVDRPDNAQPLFDESFFMYGEDVELSWRFQRQGGRLLLLDSAYLSHTGSASSGRASEVYERYLVQSHWMLADKLASSVLTRILMRIFRIPSLVARACVRSIRYRSQVPLRALAELLR